MKRAALISAAALQFFASKEEGQEFVQPEETHKSYWHSRLKRFASQARNKLASVSAVSHLLHAAHFHIGLPQKMCPHTKFPKSQVFKFGNPSSEWFGNDRNAKS